MPIGAAPSPERSLNTPTRPGEEISAKPLPSGAMRNTRSWFSSRSVITTMSISLAADAEAVLDVHVVRAIEAGEHLADGAVETERHQRTRRRLHLVGAEDEASGGVGAVDPDRRVVGIVGDRRRGDDGLDESHRGRRIGRPA